MSRSFWNSLVALGAVSSAAFGGPINPPAGPVAPTPGPEPRTAINSVNTPGDNDGTPSLFKITQPGSYYLVGNITGVSGKHGIEISASGVTLDLNGFDLLGVAGTQSGVFTSAGAQTNIAVKNGSVRNWGETGVSLTFSSARNCRVDSVRSSGNGNVGISVNDGGAITNCSAFANAATGIGTGSGCVITACTAHENGSAGFSPGGGATVSNCSANNNVASGFSLGGGGTITNCDARSNGGDGIFVGSASIVADCSASYNTRNGIQCSGEGSVIRGNTSSYNGLNAGDGAGIVINSVNNRIEGNSCNDNDRGIELDTFAVDNLIIRNSCADNTTNWVIFAGNIYGPIIDRTSGSFPAVSGNAAAGTLGSTDANANYTY